jgi:hypothetical protein
MLRRWIQLLLLASVAFWATGSAAYLHELIEHTHAPAAYADRAITKASKPGGHRDSEQECPVCASLAAMHLANVAPTIAVSAATPCVGSAVVYQSFTLSKSAISLPQTRGPPSLLRSFHSA